MSHVATIKTEIKDLPALKAACSELGLEWIEGKTNYEWYGYSVGDYPLPSGMTQEQLGKCSHVIRLPGCKYEIGVVKTPTGWTLAYDFWGPGQALLNKLGQGCQKLVQLYGVHRATQQAVLKGYSVQRTVQSNGSITLSLGGIR